MKHLYDDNDRYTNSGLSLDAETTRAVRTTFNRYVSRGYSVREIAHVMQKSIRQLESEEILARDLAKMPVPKLRGTSTIGQILLEEFMCPMHLCVDDVVKKTGLSCETINNILSDSHELVWSHAIQLATAFGNSPEFWWNTFINSRSY